MNYFSNKIPVVIESPYAGNVQKNEEYARMCLRDSLMKGEAPLASHLLYTQRGVLDDDLPEERRMGIWAGFSWLQYAKKHVFYLDLGWSEGMKDAYALSLQMGFEPEIRYLFNNNGKK